MTKTLRRRDLKKPVHDGKCWRGCDGSYCPICSGDRTNKKDNEAHKTDECDIHIENCFTDAFGGGSIMERIKNPLVNYCKCIEPWIMETHDDYMCERCGKRYG